MIYTDRKEFEALRSVCDCENCTLNCEFIPGYLIPADLERIAKARGYTANLEEEVIKWASRELLASPGATVLRHDGQRAKVPTLVPARRFDEACVHLTAEGRCAIHDVAPFGCAFFHAHQPKEESDELSATGLRAIIVDILQDGLYIRIWAMLWESGRRAPGPRELRQRMAAELYARSNRTNLRTEPR